MKVYVILVDRGVVAAIRSDFAVARREAIAYADARYPDGYNVLLDEPGMLSIVQDRLEGQNPDVGIISMLVDAPQDMNREIETAKRLQPMRVSFINQLFGTKPAGKGATFTLTPDSADFKITLEIKPNSDVVIGAAVGGLTVSPEDFRFQPNTLGKSISFLVDPDNGNLVGEVDPLHQQHMEAWGNLSEKQQAALIAVGATQSYFEHQTAIDELYRDGLLKYDRLWGAYDYTDKGRQLIEAYYKSKKD
jgi:hypothetical protein